MVKNELSRAATSKPRRAVSFVLGLVLIVLGPTIMMLAAPTPAQADSAQGNAILAAAMQYAVQPGQTPSTPYCWAGGGINGPSHGQGEVASEYSGPVGQSGCAGASIVGFDCSGLSQYAVYQGTGGAITLPRTSQDQANDSRGASIASGSSFSNAALASAQPGDLIFFQVAGPGFDHVGIYAGGSQVVNAYDYKNDGTNGTNNQYWGVMEMPTNWWNGYAYKIVRFSTAGGGGTIPASHLHQFYVSNGHWTAFDVSNPTSQLVTSDVSTNASGEFARDGNGHLRQFYVANGHWTSFDVSSATGVAISGDPFASSTGNEWARSTSGHLRQFYVSNGHWTAFDVSGATGVTIAGDPVQNASGVWARSAAGHLWQFYVSNGHWVAFDVSSATGVTIASDPSYNSSGEWARSSGGHLWQFYVSNGHWVAFDVSSATGVTIANRPFATTGQVWGITSGGHLRQFYVSNGHWTAFDVSSATGVTVAGNPASGNGSEWARSPGAFGHLWQFYVSSGHWVAFDVSKATGVNIQANPTVSSGGLWAG